MEDFRQVLQKCEATLKPYVDKLSGQPMSIGRALWTVKFIGKKNEIDVLQKQITSQYQALTLCIQFMHLWVGTKQFHIFCLPEAVALV